MINSIDARNALDAIAAPDRADDVRDAIRSLLICRDDDCRAELVDDLDITRATVDAIATLIAAIDDDPYFRDPMTDLLLSYSLCPLHRIDYAICFDDDEPSCAAIRLIHNSHDT